MGTASNTSSPGLWINKGVPRQVFNRFVVWLLRSQGHAPRGLSKFAMLLRYTECNMRPVHLAEEP